MRSEGMAKEMPAATLSVLMPMTSPSWVWEGQRAITLGAPEAAEHRVGAQSRPGCPPARRRSPWAQRLSWRCPGAHIWVRRPLLSHHILHICPLPSRECASHPGKQRSLTLDPQAGF